MTEHPFTRLEKLVDDYSGNRESFDLEKLQSIREDISTCLFYLSDSASLALSNYDQAEHVRKMKMAEREQFHRNSIDEDGKRVTVSEAQNLARLDCKKEVEDCKEAHRQRERVKIILSSTNSILHAIASRLVMLK